MRPPNGHFFAQDESEFNQLLEIMKDSKSMLEVGSRYGESLRRFAEVMDPRSRVVSVDLGRCVDSREHSGPWLYKVCGDIAERGQDIHLILGDSHDPKVVDQVKALAPFDFIFIDGDHSKEGVNLDWVNYGGLGKIVAFHDIGIACIGDLYKSITVEKKKCIWNEPGGPGIGVLWR